MKETGLQITTIASDYHSNDGHQYRRTLQPLWIQDLLCQLLEGCFIHQGGEGAALQREHHIRPAKK